MAASHAVDNSSRAAMRLSGTNLPPNSPKYGPEASRNDVVLGG
ncbi:hypothetical protein ACFPRL_01625 [Pseudoclavibacter helvolus]